MASSMEAALRYAERGWAVFPLAPGQKKPIYPGGFKNATKDSEQIRRLWKRHPNANVGIATGTCSAIVALDIDRKNNVDGEASLRSILGGREAPVTLEATTPSGGRHLFFDLPAGTSIGCSAGKLGQGLDVRGIGGYIVAAPSSIDGKQYRWSNTEPLALAPDWLQIKPASAGVRAALKGHPDAEILSLIRQALPFINADNRDDWLKCGWAIARYTGQSPEGFEMWMEWAIKSSRHDPARDPQQMEKEYFEGSQNDVPNPATIATLFHLAREGGWADARRDGDHYRLATAFLQVIAVETGNCAVYAMGCLWTVDDLLWRSMTIDGAAARVGEIFGGGKHCKRGSDFYAVAKLACNISAKERFFEGAAIGIATPGGFWHVTAKGEIVSEPLTTAHRQRMRVKVDPDPKTPPRKFLRMLSEAFAGHDPKAQIRLAQQLCGAAIARSLWRHRVVALLLGASSSGKSTLLSVLSKVFPPDQIAATSPQRWDSEYFVASLAGKALNIVGELDPKHPIPGGIFKTVTGRDQIEGRHPTHRPFTFVCEAAHFFNTNRTPPTSDRSDAFFRRWRILYFANSVSPAREERDLDQQIIDNELGAFLWWALEGAAEVEREQRLLETKAHHLAIKRWRVENNSALAFIADGAACRMVSDGSSISGQDLFNAYRKWADDNGVRAFGRSGFYEALAAGGASGVRLVDRDHQRQIEGVQLVF